MLLSVILTCAVISVFARGLVLYAIQMYFRMLDEREAARLAADKKDLEN